MDYLAIEEAAALGDASDFQRHVRMELIPRLVEAGRLQGNDVAGVPCVAWNDQLERFSRLGIERFVENQQGYSFVAVEAPIEAVAEALRDRAGVLEYRESVGTHPLQRDAGLAAAPDRRDVFLLRIRDTDWTVLVETVHWVQSSDMLMVLLMAAELSERLRTRAVAAWDDDFSGSYAVLCERGRKKRASVTEEDHLGYFGLFYELGISVPPCFIASDGGPARLLTADPSRVERADHAVLGLPDESRSGAPHVFYKLEAIGAALMGEIEDEGDFCARTVERLWRQVQAIRKAGP